MTPTYSFTVINVKNLINNALRQRELIEVREKIDSLCRKMGYRFVKTCNDCSELAPKELFLIDKEDYSKRDGRNFRKILASPKGIRKLQREAFFGAVTCSHYAEKGWYREKGLIFSQEYYIKLAHKSETSEQTAGGHLDLSLGNMECHGYGNWKGREKFLYEGCRDKLEIPKNVVIKSLNLSKITGQAF